MSKKVYICCPGDSVTGGPELLHQFCDELCKVGVDANIIYYPLDMKFSVPKQYEHYNTPVATKDDVQQDNAIIIIPEVSTPLAKNFGKADICIWWLSVDNYFGRKKYNRFVRRYLGHTKSVLTGDRLPICAMKKYFHLSQSEYAKIFLKSRGIQCEMLTDYLNETHLSKVDNSIIRDDVILYNPKKGSDYSKRLISRFPNYQFIPIQNMTAGEVRALLEKSKIYIDFGEHPGKDRFPREAVMAGCCVITGRLGSAANTVDVPVPSRYKIDQFAGDFEDKFQKITDVILSDYINSYSDFTEYKDKILQEFDVFKKQVGSFAGKHCRTIK